MRNPESCCLTCRVTASGIPDFTAGTLCGARMRVQSQHSTILIVRSSFGIWNKKLFLFGPIISKQLAVFSCQLQTHCPHPHIFRTLKYYCFRLTFVPRPVTGGQMNCESTAARNKCNAMMDPTNGNLRACGARETPAFVRRKTKPHPSKVCCTFSASGCKILTQNHMDQIAIANSEN